MANQDVQIREVDVIRAYNQKFGEFYVSFSERLRQFRHALEAKLEELQQINQEIKSEREKIEEEIRQAKEKCEDSYNHGSYVTHRRPDGSRYSTFVPDYRYINQCRDECDHLCGPVYHHAQDCENHAHNRLVQATQIINMIEQQTDKISSSYQKYVERGQQFLDKAVQYIDSYKENGPQV